MRGPGATRFLLFLAPIIFIYELSQTNARRTWHVALGPTDIPHTRRTPAAPARSKRKADTRPALNAPDSEARAARGTTTDLPPTDPSQGLGGPP